MKKTFLFFAAMTAVSVSAATVGKVICRQQWPWNSDIKVEYLLSGVSGPVDIKVQCYNGEEELDSGVMHNAISGEVFNVRSSGVKTFTIDPVKAFGAGNLEMKDFNVRLTAVPATADYDEVLYKVFDLTGEPPYSCTDITREDLLNGKYGDYETDFGRIGDGFNTTLSDVLIWTAVTNGTEYKTDKLVMRKIPAAGVEWKIGSPETEKGADYVDNKGREDQHTVRLTEDFFMSVFEVTQAQFAKFYPLQGGFTNESDSAVRPVESVDYGNDLRGLSNWVASDGSASRTEWVFWPTNAYRHCVRYNRALGIMRDRLKVKMDLPTEAQWEFACRAGATNALYSGKEMITTDNNLRDRHVDEIAWVAQSDYSDAPGGTNQTRAVGLKKPNAFGLYDMAGNVSEWCLDWYYNAIEEFYDETGDGMEDVAHSDPLVDPVGRSMPYSNDNLRSMRGGHWNTNHRYSRSAYRFGIKYTAAKSTFGLRIVCPVAKDWK